MNFRSLATLVFLLASGRAVADDVSLFWVGPELPSEVTERWTRATELALGELSAASVVPVARPQGRRSCVDDEDRCLLGLAQRAGTDSSLILEGALSRGMLSLRAFWVDIPHKSVTRADLRAKPDEPESVRGAVQKVLPPFERKGWGALVLDAPTASGIRVDGKRLPVERGVPVAVPAGAHEVDVLFPQGAVLERESVPEGSRVRLDPSDSPAPSSVLAGSEAPDHSLRMPAYAIWSAGALSIAGSLIAGALSRNAARDLTPCAGTDRSCVFYDQAATSEHRAQVYAQNGNILLVTGLVLSAAGAGLFTYDALKGSGP